MKPYLTSGQIAQIMRMQSRIWSDSHGINTIEDCCYGLGKAFGLQNEDFNAFMHACTGKDYHGPRGN